MLPNHEMVARYFGLFSSLAPQASESAIDRWTEGGDSQCAVASVVIAEIERGLHWEGRVERWARYEALLKGRLEVVSTPMAVWEKFARMKARQYQLGEKVADLDLLIAAAAVANDLTIATLNTKDFSRIEGLAWEDWGK
jgi:predicted nucleic acid-binding protein